MPMKNVLRLIAKFIFSHVLLTVIICTVYYLYLQCTQLVAGKTPDFLPISSIASTFPLLLACVSIFASFLTQVDIVRNGSRVLLQIISATLVLAVWFFFLPSYAALQDRFFADAPQVQPVREISAGYFRPYLGGVLFTTSEGASVEGVYFRKSSPGSNPTRSFGIPASELQSENFSDVLIADTFHFPPFLLILSETLLFFLRIARDSWSEGFLSWICFGSMGLPLAAISALSRAGSWKLKNFITMELGYVLIIFLNRQYYIYNMFDYITGKGFLPQTGGLFALPDIPHILFNLILALIITGYGLFVTHFAFRNSTGDDE
jgi:hypothetical protein